MSWSINEIQTLAAKAARGAGFPAAQADRFGRAAVVHLAMGGDENDLLSALDDPDNSPILRLPLLADDILRAAEFMGDALSLSLQPGDEALAPAYAQSLHITIAGCSVEMSGEVPQLTLTLGQGTSAPNMPARIDLSDQARERLLTLGKNTEVPETEESRLHGAGAGLTDND